jgi:Na+-driven multidrug efflux pump
VTERYILKSFCSNPTNFHYRDAQATLCAHAVGAGNYFLAGQYIQLTQIVFVLTGFLPLLVMGSFMYQLLVWLDVSNDVATLGGSFASVQVIALLVDGFNNAQMQFLSAIDPSIYSNVIEILMNASYTAGVAVYLNRNSNASLVDLAWIKLSVAVLFIPINIIVLSMRGWLDLCWVGMARSNSLKNKQALKQMLKTGVPLGIGSLIRESEWALLVLFASHIGTDDVATFAVVRRTSDIFSSLIEGLW